MQKHCFKLGVVSVLIVMAIVHFLRIGMTDTSLPNELEHIRVAIQNGAVVESAISDEFCIVWVDKSASTLPSKATHESSAATLNELLYAAIKSTRKQLQDARLEHSPRSQGGVLNSKE